MCRRWSEAWRTCCCRRFGAFLNTSEEVFSTIRPVAISLESRRVGDVPVVTCSGRIVEGAESLALQRTLDDLLQYGPHLILHLGGIDFLDRSGLGLLVRYVSRIRNANGTLRLCALPPKIVEVLKATHLRPIFDVYESEDEAITAYYQRAGSGAATTQRHADVLCVDGSRDVQALVREVLGQHGYGVLTAGNMPDALILLQATAPTLVIVSTELRQMRTTRAGDRFNTLA